MLTLIKNANVYSPIPLGKKDILIGGEKILAIQNKIEENSAISKVWDAQGKTLTSGFIDQHVHVIGAGGKRGFASMTPEIKVTELIACVPLPQ